MDVTAKTIANTDRPEASATVQQTATETPDSNVTVLSEIKQAVSSSANTNRTNQGLSGNDSTGNQAQLTREDVEDMVEALEDFANTLQTKVNFAIDDGTEDVVVKIIDKETDEIIKQFPAEDILELREKMQDLSGLLFSTNI